MQESDKQVLLQRYNERLQKFGYSPKSLGWDKSRHELRYFIFLSQWNLKNASVLDFGCGFGDMYGYAKKMELEINYEGIDINKNLIDEGKKIYPEACLTVRDAFSEGLEKKYDYIFSSGVHNLKIKDNWQFIEKTFELFDKYSLKGFALNFLSDRVEYELEDTFHTNPVKLLDLAYKYSNRIILRNDYMPFEFSIFVNKQSEFDKKTVVYPEYVKYVTSNE